MTRRCNLYFALSSTALENIEFILYIARNGYIRLVNCAFHVYVSLSHPHVRKCLSDSILSINSEEIYSISTIIGKHSFTKMSNTLFMMHIIRIIEKLGTFMFKQLRDAFFHPDYDLKNNSKT